MDASFSKASVPPMIGSEYTAIDRPFCHGALTILRHGMGFLLFLQLMIITAVVLAGVIARYVFNASFPWTEELASWLLVSLTFTGMAIGHVGGRHITIDLTSRLGLSREIERARAFLVETVVSLSMFLLLDGGIGLVQNLSGVSPGLEWDVRIKVIAIPLACFIGFVFMALGKLCEGRSWLSSLLPIVTGAMLYELSDYWAPYLGDLSASLVMAAAFFSSLVLGVPVAFAMLFAGCLPGLSGNLLPVMGVVSTVVEGASMFVILAIPFFLTAGYLMNSGGLSKRLIDFAYALTGHFRGGLAQANIFHSVMLGGVCGSSNADAASTTKILVPQMVKRGYSIDFACAVTAVGSILPACFPPSISLLVYASVSGVSVARLFTAGIIPGILLCVVMMIVTHFIAKRRHYEKAPHRAPIGTMVRTGMSATPALFVAIVIVGLLRVGVMTATEVGTIAVVWAFVFGKFIYRGFTMREFYAEMVECAIDTALICFLVGVAHPIAWVMLADQLPQQFVTWLVPLVHAKWEMFLLINIGTFIAGCLLEVVPSIFILAPVLTPLLAAMGVDPVHGGIIIMLNLILSTAAPPMGILVFTSSTIARTSPGPVFRECIPFIAACYFVLLLVTFVPGISLSLWDVLGQ